MRNPENWAVWGVALLCLTGASCSRHADSKELAALDAAYQSGVLTRSEYDAKKAALSAQDSAAAPLAALDKALHDGVFTKDEYDARKARLLAQAVPLAALEKARAAGLLNDAEYQSKKNGLLAADVRVPAQSPSEPSAVPVPAGALTESRSIESTPAPPVAAPAPSTALPPTPAPPPPPARDSAPVQPVSAASPSVDPQGHSYRMKVAKVMDSQGFERPMPSLTLLIPVDWQFQGATTWNIKDSCNTIQTRLSATGPDGRGFENFPAYNWVWADNPQFQKQIFAQKAQMGTHACDVMPPMTAQEYLRRNLARLRPNAQLMGMEPAPKLLENLTAQARQSEQAGRQYNLVKQVKADAARARVKYSLNGKSVEEWIFAGIVIDGTRGPSMDMRTMQQTQAWTYNCVAYTAAQHSAPGELDGSVKFFELIGSTYRQNPEWQAKVTNNAMAMQKIEQKGIADRSAIVRKSAEETRQIQQQGYENRSRSQDSINEQFSQTIRGVESYRNPGTGETFELDSNYGHAWVNNQGEYLLSDQSSFDPNTVKGNTQSWTQLQHVKK